MTRSENFEKGKFTKINLLEIIQYIYKFILTFSDKRWNCSHGTRYRRIEKFNRGKNGTNDGM